MKIDRSYIHRLALADEYRKRNKFLDDQFLIDSEGCLDALDFFPTGSVVPMQYGPDNDEFIPMISIVWRES